MLEEAISFEDVRGKVLTLPPTIFRCLTYRVEGLPPPQIAQKMGVAEITVKKYNEQIIDTLNIGELTRTERDVYLFVIVRPIVHHIQQNPYYMSIIEANPECVNYGRLFQEGISSCRR
jgi:hypothetical protein